MGVGSVKFCRRITCLMLSGRLSSSNDWTGFGTFRPVTVISFDFLYASTSCAERDKGLMVEKISIEKLSSWTFFCMRWVLVQEMYCEKTSRRWEKPFEDDGGKKISIDCPNTYTLFLPQLQWGVVGENGVNSWNILCMNNKVNNNTCMERACTLGLSL